MLRLDLRTLDYGILASTSRWCSGSGSLLLRPVEPEPEETCGRGSGCIRRPRDLEARRPALCRTRACARAKKPSTTRPTIWSN
jgi:hypothetical protein